MQAQIRGISYFLPEQIVSNEEMVLQFPDWSVEKIAGKIGVKNRHVTGKDEFVSDLAVKASERLFEEYAVDRGSIDFVLLCTQSPDYFLPATACLVQDRLRIPKTAGAIDFNQGCSGFIYGLALAKGLVESGIAQNVLLITAETYTKHIHASDRGNRTIFGDAAASTLISNDGFATIGNFDLGTDGSGAGNLIVKNGAMKNPRQSLGVNSVMDDYLFMDGPKIFNFTQERVPVLVRNTLQKNNLSNKDVDWYIFHQANDFMLSHLRRKMGIPEDKFLLFMEHCGNTVSSTIPIVLKESLKIQKFQRRHHVLLAGFGVGYSWGGTVITMI
jgi:3-oxoacyl-[acyl-carrier-protein] synthase III